MVSMSSTGVRDMVESGIPLPDGLSVKGSLDLVDCTSLTALPDGLSVGWSLLLRGCAGLETLPDGLIVKGVLDLRGCASLTALPDGLHVGWYLCLEDCTIADDHVSVFSCSIPETIVPQIPGRPLSSIFSHALLDGTAIMSAVIKDAKLRDDTTLILTVEEGLLKMLDRQRVNAQETV